MKEDLIPLIVIALFALAIAFGSGDKSPEVLAASQGTPTPPNSRPSYPPWPPIPPYIPSFPPKEKDRKE